MRAGLTPKQEELLAIIWRSIDERGIPPTVREMGAALGIQNNAVRDRIVSLMRAGAIQIEDRRARGIRVLWPRFAFIGPVRNDRDEVVFPPLQRS